MIILDNLSFSGSELTDSFCAYFTLVETSETHSRIQYETLLANVDTYIDVKQSSLQSGSEKTRICQQ